MQGMDRLAAVGKWVALGGGALVTAGGFTPAVPVVVGLKAAPGVFALVDP